MSIDVSLCDRYVVFLDIDGVLLPVPKFTFGGGDLSGRCVQCLKRLVAALGGREKVTIVLSSTWRNHPAMVDRLNTFMQKEAGDGIPIVAERTPNGTVLVSSVTYYADDLSEQRLVRDRVDEVFRWLRTHITEHPEAIGGRWFAIDDMKLDVEERMRGHFLHTQTDVGMTDADVDTACAMIASLPSPEAAYAEAAAALADPALKQEEIEIHKVLQSRLEAQLATATAQLAEAQGKIVVLSAEKKNLVNELAEMQRSMEDMRYRLAVYNFAKRYPSLAAAVELSDTKTGAERRDLDAAIRTFVKLLMDRKELQKKMRSEAKKVRHVS
ncbi:putative HAD domain in Swiss Army Knife RNA repair protein [Leishmania naiffi]|uniref:HAD domain in Swiss Army Knife RNA repair protein n=1 Tax=Leishmania naiffi TaxID=5678 RepID=A0AAW3BQ08_9TRYP